MKRILLLCGVFLSLVLITQSPLVLAETTVRDSPPYYGVSASENTNTCNYNSPPFTNWSTEGCVSYFAIPGYSDEYSSQASVYSSSSETCDEYCSPSNAIDAQAYVYLNGDKPWLTAAIYSSSSDSLYFEIEAGYTGAIAVNSGEGALILYYYVTDCTASSYYQSCSHPTFSWVIQSLSNPSSEESPQLHESDLGYVLYISNPALNDKYYFYGGALADAYTSIVGIGSGGVITNFYGNSPSCCSEYNFNIWGFDTGA